MSGIPQVRKETPPFVRYEWTEYGINEEASKKAGRDIPKVVPFALIMQHGSRDCVEKPAEEWLAQQADKVRNGQLNPDWLKHYQSLYEQFLKGEEMPADGTPIKTWAAVKREQVIRLLALNIQTVEQLAQYPDSSLGTIGLDGRHLRDLARNFIEQGLNNAGAAKKIADLEQRDRDKDDIIKRLEAQVAELAKQAQDRKK